MEVRLLKMYEPQSELKDHVLAISSRIKANKGSVEFEYGMHVNRKAFMLNLILQLPRQTRTLDQSETHIGHSIN